MPRRRESLVNRISLVDGVTTVERVASNLERCSRRATHPERVEMVDFDAFFDQAIEMGRLDLGARVRCVPADVSPPNIVREKKQDVRLHVLAHGWKAEVQ